MPKSKRRCGHCNELYHPYSAESVVCPKCNLAARSCWWAGKPFHSPVLGLQVEKLTKGEYMVLRAMMAHIEKRVDIYEKFLDNIEADGQAILPYKIGRWTKRAVSREERYANVDITEEMKGITRTQLSKMLGWNLPKLGRVLEPLLRFKLVIESPEKKLIPNYQLMSERIKQMESA